MEFPIILILRQSAIHNQMGLLTTMQQELLGRRTRVIWLGMELETARQLVINELCIYYKRACQRGSSGNLNSRDKERTSKAVPGCRNMIPWYND